MTSRDFCCWLQGYFEIHGENNLTNAQVEMIQRHLALVFIHEIDPSNGGDAANLQAVHDGKPPVTQPSPIGGGGIKYCC